MEKKYKIEFDGKELVFENEKEFKKFKAQCYNIHCDIMIDSQFNKGKVIRKSTGHTPEPEITLKDVVNMINQLAKVVNDLTIEMREGFRRVDVELKKVNARLDKHEEILMRHEEILMRHEEILMRHEETFKRNNLR